MINWSIIGTGDVAAQVADDLAATPGAVRLAVASRSAERGRQFAADHGFARHYTTSDALFTDPDVDIVYIATPHATHRQLAVEALQSGKHVLIEKPAGVDEAEVRQIADVAARHQRFAMEAMWMRFNPVYRRLLGELQAGAVGQVMSVRASFGIPFPAGVGSRWSASMRGSTLLDQGVYPLTLALDVLGVPAAVSAVGTVRPDGVDLREHITLDYHDARYAHLAASMVEWVDPTAAISGTTGWIHVPFPFWAAESYSVHTGRQLFQPRTVSTPKQGHGYIPMLTAVVDALNDGRLEHPLHPWKDVMTRQTVLDRIRAELSTRGGDASSQNASTTMTPTSRA